MGPAGHRSLQPIGNVPVSDSSAPAAVHRPMREAHHTPTGTPLDVDRFGSAAIAAALAVAVLAALVGGVAARLGVGIVVALVTVGAARLLRSAWRDRVSAGIAAALLLGPVVGLGLVALDRSARTPDRVAQAVDLAVATLFVAAATLVFAGVRRLVLIRRRNADTPWVMLATAGRPDDHVRRTGRLQAAAGISLLAAGLLLVGFAPRGLAGLGVSWPGALLLAVLAVAALIAAPALAAITVVGRRDRAERERALQRQAVAAHLHDSVLQTFALVQRRLDDPDEVRRLIRRQERELRDWLAGREPARPDTLTGALQQVIDEIELELHVPIELEILGDRPVDPSVGSLIDATREALRNAARHGGGAAIRVLAAADGPITEVYVRDEGPGFVPDAVPIERRGIRDAIIGRMAAVGGSAVIDAVPGAGTEVVLRLPMRTEGVR